MKRRVTGITYTEDPHPTLVQGHGQGQYAHRRHRPGHGDNIYHLDCGHTKVKSVSYGPRKYMQCTECDKSYTRAVAHGLAKGEVSATIPPGPQACYFCKRTATRPKAAWVATVEDGATVYKVRPAHAKCAWANNTTYENRRAN